MRASSTPPSRNCKPESKITSPEEVDTTIVNFTPLSAAIGGALIGLAAALLMLLTGRIAGICGILGGRCVSGADKAGGSPSSPG